MLEGLIVVAIFGFVVGYVVSTFLDTKGWW
jgi:hypothetical protein